MSDGFVDFPTLRRPSSPNTHLIAPDGLCKNAAPDAAAPVWPTPPSELLAAVKQIVSARDDWRDLRVDETGLRLAFVARTPILKFKDDVDVAALPADQGATLAAYSRSRLGYSDLGANARRLGELLAAL